MNFFKKISGTKSVSKTETIKSVKIGSQVWMLKNLDVDKFRNGDIISNVESDVEWKKYGNEGKPAWCYYKNDPDNGATYGKLYNWYAVNDPRGLAPTGWHIPTADEWVFLTLYLGGKRKAGDRLKEMGFSSLLGGCRNHKGEFDPFKIIKYWGYWWSATEHETYSALYRNIFIDESYIWKSDFKKQGGLSVVCLKD